MNINYSYDKEFTDLLNKYSQKELELEGISNKQLDVNSFSKKFFATKTIADSSIDGNANVDNIGVIAYSSEVFKSHSKLNSIYLLWKELKRLYHTDIANELISLEIEGDIYINDSTGINFPYCYNFSTMDIASCGMPFIPKVKIEPPKHLSSFMGQIVHFSVYASNSVMGAVGLADLLIVASFYAKKIFEEYPPDLALKVIKQELQSFIYSCNQPFRGGVQSGFYNISVYDDYFLNELCEGYHLFGETADITMVKLLQEMFLTLMNETLNETVITYPIITACFSVDDDKNIKDETFLDLILEQNQKYGHINMYAGKTSTLSSCCRLRSDADKVKEFFNMFGSGSTKIGSFGVVTINLPRITKNSKDDPNMVERLEYLVEAALKINNAKRRILQRRIDAGMLPLYEHGFMTLKSQYSTIGLVGISEMCDNLSLDIITEEGQAFVSMILEKLTSDIDYWSSKYGYMINIEQVPAENSAVKLAQKDGEILYSNQFIPLTKSANILDRINIQGKFDDKLSGGGILHINIDEPIEDLEITKKLTKHVIKSGVVYFAENMKLNRCVEGHISTGNKSKCDVCNKEIVDIFTRVVGFLTNTKNWNKTRREFDFPERKWYKT